MSEENRASEKVDEAARDHAAFTKVRESAAEKLTASWKCVVAEADEYPFDWIFVRNDIPATLASYHQHKTKGNVLIPAHRWYNLRTWSVNFMLPHIWIVDMFASGLRYKLYPQHSGFRPPTMFKDGVLYITLGQNDFDILRDQ